MSNKPITRKEMFMAKASGQNVNTPKPITREEKFLERIAENGGKATSWKDLGEKTVMGDTLTWDGNTEGLEVATVNFKYDNSMSKMYRIFEATPTIENLANGFSITFANGYTEVYPENSDAVVIINDKLIGTDFGLIAYEDNITATQDEDIIYNIPKKGVYTSGHILDEPGDNITSITINGYNGFPRTEITPLPNKYLDIVETVGGDTLKWDGNTEGKLIVTDSNGYMYVKLFDAVPSEADCAGGFSYVDSAGYFAENTVFDQYGEDIRQIDGTVVLVSKDDTSYKDEYEDGSSWSLHFPEKGIYSYYDPTDTPAYHMSSFTINGYTGFPKEQVKQEYLPSGVYVIKVNTSEQTVVYNDDIFNLLPHELLHNTCVFCTNFPDGETRDGYVPIQGVTILDGMYMLGTAYVDVYIDPINKTIELD